MESNSSPSFSPSRHQAGPAGRLTLSLSVGLLPPSVGRTAARQVDATPQGVDATPQGVSLLAKRVHALLHAALPASARTGDSDGSSAAALGANGSKGDSNGSSNNGSNNNGSSVAVRGKEVARREVARGVARRLGELSQQLTSDGAEEALGALADMLAEGVTSRELEESGVAEALLAFLSDPCSAERRRRARLVRRALMSTPALRTLRTTSTTSASAAPEPLEEEGAEDAGGAGADAGGVRRVGGGGEGRAMAALVRHLLGMLAANETLPVALSAEAAAGETGLGQLLQPHRVNLSPVAPPLRRATSQASLCSQLL
ncbi:hypothetical protein T484DRAFT_1915772 [Baffinella frigidus]|nr:hypothetical protein T484DRAFT_1915772 [Cryptophyta sp. CCMP2293]